jgi:type I restriction enzyme S subunit
VSTYELALPPLEEQRRIAEVLGALDDRIEVSRSLIEALAASIQLEAAAVVQSAGEATQLLTDVATIVNGYSYKSSELVEDSDTAMVNLKNFGRHGGFRLDGLKPFDGTPKPTQMLVSGDAMVAKTDLTQGAEVIGRCLRMPDLPQFDRYVASLDIAIVRSKGQLPQLTLCALLAQPEFRDHCLGFVSGTTVLHMSKAALETYTLPVLDTGRVAALTTRVDALAAQQDRTLIELYHLQQMRDFLLPRLVSGELRVAAAEDLVEAAT